MSWDNENDNLPCGVSNWSVEKKFWKENEMNTADIVSSLELGIRSLEGRISRERDHAIKLLEEGLFDAALRAVMNAQAAKYAVDELSFQIDEIEASRG
jgi:hypothetical protein